MLCDAKNVLGRINKNLVYDIINSRENKENPVSNIFLNSWQNFIFNYYFKLLFKMSENLIPIKTNWRNTVNFNKDTNRQDVNQLIANNKVMISIFKVPQWLSNQELIQLGNKSDKVNYLFIMYNPKARDGKKVTVSYHKSKTLDEVKEAEINYKQVITKKSIIGMILGFIFFITEGIQKSFGSELPILSYTFLFIGGGLVLYDMKKLIENLSDDGFSDVVTSKSKSMSGRLDSSATFFELEHLLRIEKTLLTKSIINILQTDNNLVSDAMSLFVILKEKHDNLSKYLVQQLTNDLIDSGIIEKSNGYYKLSISEEVLSNSRILDERLYEQYDLDNKTTDLIYRSYIAYIDTINKLLRAENKRQLNIKKC